MLLHGDCLNEMKQLDDDSVDLIFCDLPYGQTSCEWDCKIDLEAFWKEILRIKKTHTPLFFTTTTKFGIDLLNSAPKKCPFRYDLVWMKSSAAGFLSAKKMPMRKHEMIYVFYEKLPFYDLSSHQHKFVKEVPVVKDVKEGGEYNHIYGNIKDMDYQHLKGKMGNPVYDPPLPVSVVKEENRERKVNPKNSNKGGLYSNIDRLEDVKYDPPLPHSMLEIKSTRGKHSTEKPVALMEWILKYYSKEGDVVLDPTMGSGSTGVACKNMNRNFIGIEMDPEIFEVAVNRVED